MWGVAVSGVEVRGIAKRFGTAAVLEGISAHFEDGRFTSLLGPSGSGKTTLLRIIGGFVGRSLAAPWVTPIARPGRSRRIRSSC